MRRPLAIWLGALLLVVASMGAAAQASSDRGASVPPTAQPLPTDIPFKRDPAPETERPGSALLAWSVFVAMALLLVGVWVRRRGRPAGALRLRWLALPGERPAQLGSAPEVLSRTRLTPRHTVCVLQWDGGQYLLACTDQGVQLLAQRASPGEAGQQSATP